MTRSDRWRLCLFAGAALLAALHVGTAARIQTGFADFLNDPARPRMGALAEQLADGPLSRTIILSVGASDLDAAIEAARRWAPELRAHPEVAELLTGPPPDLLERGIGLYLPHRHALLSSDPERELPERLSDAGLRAAARELRLALARPESAWLLEHAAADPLQALPAILERIEASASGGLGQRAGHFVTRARDRAVLFLTTRHSALDTEHAAPLLEEIAGSFERLRAESPVPLDLERSAVHRFAVASEATAKREMAWLTGISLPAVCLLFLWIFRSGRLLALSLIPLLAGTLFASSITLWVFGELNALTLAFGAVLIGICVDFPIHYINHHRLLGGTDARASFTRIRPALVLGASTTIAGFAGLLVSGIPAIQQMGLFSAIGVLSAMASTGVAIPPLLGAAGAKPAHRRLTRAMEALLRALERRARPLAWVLLLAGGALGALGLPRAQLQDDVFGLNVPLDPEWIAEEARVRASVSSAEAARFAVSFGRDDAQALERNDALQQRLERARERGALAGYRSLHAFLFSPELQRRNLRALDATPDLAERLSRIFQAEGFRPDAFAPFQRALSAPPADPLSLQELRDSPLAPALRGLRVALPDGVALLTPLQQVRDGDTIEAELADLEGVAYFDQQRFAREAYARYRGRVEGLVGFGLLGVLALLYLRYRRLRLALAALVPAIASGAATLAALAALGIPLNLLHLLGLFLVLSLGVDYAVFLLESEGQSAERAAALTGVVVDCASTALSFGLLAASSFPALQSLGAATALGVTLSLALAPLAVVLAQPACDR